MSLPWAVEAWTKPKGTPARPTIMANVPVRLVDTIKGVIGCYDRIVITGTLPGICHAGGMTSLLSALGIKIFDYTKWAEPLREATRANAQAIANREGLEIGFVRKLRGFRKEECVRQKLRRSAKPDHHRSRKVDQAWNAIGDNER